MKNDARRRVLAITALFVAIAGVKAERLLAEEDGPIRLAVINPAAMRQNAPEELVVEIIGVSIAEISESPHGIQSVHLLARVLSVARTRSELVKGHAILIAWQQHMAGSADSGNESIAMHMPGWAGPAQHYDPDALPLGAITRAWLRRYGDGSAGLVYVPAVRELSFERMEK